MIFTTDILVMLGMLVVGTLFTFFIGKSKAVSVLLAILGAIPLFQAFPFTTELTVATGAFPQALNIVGIFLILVIGLYFLLDRYVVEDFVESSFFKSALIGVVFTAIMLALIYFILPFEPIYDFGPNIDRWFGGNLGLFWWLAVPLTALFFL